MAARASIALRLEAQRESIETDSLAALPQPVYRALPFPEETVGSCVQAMLKALRTQSTRPVRRWLERETETPEPRQLLRCLDVTIDRIAMEAEAAGSYHLRILDWLRADARTRLAELTSPTKVDMTPSDRTLGLIDGIVQMVHSHDPDTAVHLDATAELAEWLARDVAEQRRLDEAFVTRCSLAARLHDVGKIAVPAELLNKRGPLCSDEWVTMRRHPLESERILGGVPELARLSAIVRAHHERIDGRGYPDGLAGEAIPLESRVVAIVDAFHAMTVPRPYRKPLAVSMAIDELVGGAEAQFDGPLVDSFIEALYRRRGDRRIA